MSTFLMFSQDIERKKWYQIEEDVFTCIKVLSFETYIMYQIFVAICVANYSTLNWHLAL